MRFSFWPGPQQPWAQVLEMAHHAEATGWDGIWFADHFMPAGGDTAQPVQECWATLAGLAALVPRVRLGSLVAGNTYRHPAVLAKAAATIDQISGGRLVLGLGAGWQENEHEAYGIHFGTTGERLSRLEEACQVVTGLLRRPRTSLDGAHYTLRDAPLEPKPVQERMPLLIGGGGERVTLRIAARYADEWNVWGSPDVIGQKTEVLERHCADVGRDPAEIRRSAQALLFLSDDQGFLDTMRNRPMGMPTLIGTPAEVAEVVGEYRDAGLDELIVPDFTLGPPERAREILDRFITEVAPDFR